MPVLIDRTIKITDFDITRTDRTGRTVTAYAAVFDQEAEIRDGHGHYVETIHRSAFNRSVSPPRDIARIGVFYNHGYDLSGQPNMLGAVPIATPQEIRPDGKGLLTISRYNDSELSDAVLAAWEGGQITGQSFRGAVHKDRRVGKQGSLDVIERTELGLKEYGPTHAPAYVGAGLVAIRSQDELAELVRSMITQMTGTPSASPVTSVTASAPDATGDSPMTGHSSRTRARQILLRAKAIELGARKNEAS
jgi:HK97 family phage prohead protease